MDRILLSRFQPLNRVLMHDVFHTGQNGWMEIMPNFCEAPDFEESSSIMVQHRWPPVILSTATFRYPGSHGSLSGGHTLGIGFAYVAALLKIIRCLD